MLRNALQTILNLSAPVPQALIPHIFLHPFEITCAKTHYTVPSLPFKCPITKFVICIVRRRTFELANKFAYQDSWRKANGQVNVSFDAPDFVDVNACCVDAPAPQIVLDNYFDLWNEKGRTSLSVPHDMQVDFRIVISGHKNFAPLMLKPKLKKPR
jgi:hypothetical protein